MIIAYEVLFFFSGSEDETVFPDNFEDVMAKKAMKLFEWKPADPNLEKNCSESIALLKGCLSKRKLVL